MAHRKLPEKITADNTAVPVALKHLDAPEWRDPAEFRRWCAGNLEYRAVSPRQRDYLDGATPGVRWRAAVDRWAVEHRFGRESWPRLPDWPRLLRAGVPSPSALPRPRIVAAPVEAF